MRKPDFCICENKGADQLCGNRKADQRLCFRYTDSIISLLPKSKISSLLPSSVAEQPGLCGTRSKHPKTGFLTTRLICLFVSYFVELDQFNCQSTVHQNVQKQKQNKKNIFVRIAWNSSTKMSKWNNKHTVT